MSGVNAHVLLSGPSYTQAAETQQLRWQRERHWVAPAGHPLLRHWHKTMLVADLSAAGLSYLHDHVVLGRVLLAGAALFEMTAAAGRALCGTAPVPALAALAIAAPYSFTVSSQPALLACSVDLRWALLSHIY
jgi:hypothetical protein